MERIVLNPSTSPSLLIKVLQSSESKATERSNKTATSQCNQPNSQSSKVLFAYCANLSFFLLSPANLPLSSCTSRVAGQALSRNLIASPLGEAAVQWTHFLASPPLNLSAASVLLPNPEEREKYSLREEDGRKERQRSKNNESTPTDGRNNKPPMSGQRRRPRETGFVCVGGERLLIWRLLFHIWHHSDFL